MIEIQNSQECFVRLWRLLERTRRFLATQHRRFCLRHVLQLWFEEEANDDFIWKVCHLALVDDEPQEGWDELPPPSLHPRRHRELLRALIAVRLGIGMRKVNLRALDRAYTVAFPHSTPINVNKK